MKEKNKENEIKKENNIKEKNTNNKNKKIKLLNTKIDIVFKILL